MEQFNLENNENILSKIGVSIHSDKGETRSFKDVLDDISKAYHKLDKTKENDMLKDYIAQQLVGLQNKDEFISLINRNK